MDQYTHNGWSMDYQALPPAEISVLAMPDRLVSLLLEKIGADVRFDMAAAQRSLGRPSSRVQTDDDVLSIEYRSPKSQLKCSRPTNHRISGCRSAGRATIAGSSNALDYIGFDGGGGIGSGPGMAVGAAMALRGSGRLPVAILGDGDFLMGLTAIWTAVSHRVPLLIVVANNQSFFNDELHQERIARLRGRPVENRSVGLRMSNPPFNLALLAEGQGADRLWSGNHASAISKRRWRKRASRYEPAQPA